MNNVSNLLGECCFVSFSVSPCVQMNLIVSLMQFQVKLHFSEKALRLIAKKAMAKNTGARGLRALLESILIEAMYEVRPNDACCLLLPVNVV